MTVKPPRLFIVLAALCCSLGAFAKPLSFKIENASARNVFSLDGEWQIAEGSLDQMPAAFNHTVPVPGLIDMATPAFEAPGSTIPHDERGNPSMRPQASDPRREAFWYKQEFRIDGTLPSVAKLKINKAFFGTKVYLNGQVVGEHLPNFTPGWFDLRPYLKDKGQTNVLVVRVGASLAQVPAYLTDGWDNEKSRYIPGIYDSVSLILSGTPHIVNIQTVPDIDKKAVRVVAELDRALQSNETVKGVVTESKSGKVAGTVTAKGNGTQKVDFVIPIENGRLWSPEDPFLYTVTLDTAADKASARFGLRHFTTDPATGRAMLNGKPYFLRGSNICIYRFFEDEKRGGLPWDKEWVRNLHRKVKDMHWNSLRYCIGFPPEIWYDIADEEGILIQDEFPIWYSRAKDGWPEAITPKALAVEFEQWMRERWNHPSVVVWDSQNETRNGIVTGEALMLVRDLDLSNRPWDNGWGQPQKPEDFSEAHPYMHIREHFNNRGGFAMSEFAEHKGIPHGAPRGEGSRPPYIINEYGWLWLDREGSPTTLTTNVYARALGNDATPEQRFEFLARTLAAKTEFWRGRGKLAGLQQFCVLSYSRPVTGQTSDNFIDIEKLVYEPHFYKYVRDAFAPVGIMTDFWDRLMLPGRNEIPVVLINDLDDAWSGEAVARILKDGKTISEAKQKVAVGAHGYSNATFALTVPDKLGNYQLQVTLIGTPTGDVHSWRDFSVVEPNYARKRPVTVSSVHPDVKRTSFKPEYAVDDKLSTRWSSETSLPQWIQIDLAEAKEISTVILNWEKAHATAYTIDVSTDGKNWKTVYSTTDSKGGTETIKFDPTQARWVKLNATAKATPYGISLWEVQVR